jgi:hypothetical protein
MSEANGPRRSATVGNEQAAVTGFLVRSVQHPRARFWYRYLARHAVMGSRPARPLSDRDIAARPTGWCKMTPAQRENRGYYRRSVKHLR